MEIRQATLEDAELIARLNAPVQQLHYEARPDFYKPPALMPELIADYRDRLKCKDVYVFIASLDGHPIGYILAQVMEREDNPYSYPTRYMLIDQLSVNPEQHCKGYGEALMRHVFGLAKTLGITRAVVGVWGFNERAIAFYEHLGFTPRDIRMETRVD